MQRSAGMPMTVVYVIQILTVLFIVIGLGVEQRIKVMEPQTKAD
ncbi:MAG: hypothetical protein RMY28_028270 [Nostoc sp. ChiSLP01]